jgi:hypothetical protein
MKNLLSLSVLILLSLSSFCQHAQLTLSEDFKIAEKEYQDQTVTHSIYYNNSFYTATNAGIGGHYKWAFTKLYDMKYPVTISKFDKNMNKIKDVQLENGERQFGPLIPELILLNNQLCLAYYQTDNKSSFSFYLGLIDEANLTLRKTKKICTVQQQNVGIFKIESIINDSRVVLANSADNTKTLIACRTSENHLQTFIVDSGLNILKQADLQTATAGFDISTAVLANDNLECLVLSSEEGAKVVCSSPDGKKNEMKLGQSGNPILYASTASLSKDGKRINICSTITVAERDQKVCTGFLVAELDCSTAKIVKSSEYPFTPEIIEAIYQKGGGYKHKKEFYLYNFSPHLMESDNGDLVILGCPEQLSSSVTTSAPNMNNQTEQIATTTLEIGPVLAFYPKKGAKTFDYAVVPRKMDLWTSAGSGRGSIQMVQVPGISHSYSNFTASNLGDDILILYNDNEANLTKRDNENISEAKSTKDLVLAEALIGKDKKLQYRKQIGKNLSGRYTYYLGNIAPTTSSLVIFPVGKQGMGFSARKIFYSNWCFLDIK